MQSGKLIDSIVIQRPSTTNGAGGFRTTQWETYMTLWANLRPLFGSEFAWSKSFAATANHRVTIPYSAAAAGIQVTDRIAFPLPTGSMILSINAILNMDDKGKYEYRNRWLTILATQLVGIPAVTTITVEASNGDTGTDGGTEVAYDLVGNEVTCVASAYDQFGNVITPPPVFTWSVVSGGGTIDQNGHYIAGDSNSIVIVQASSGGVVGQAQITVSDLEFRSLSNEEFAGMTDEQFATLA